MLTNISHLLGKYERKGFAKAVTRAIVLEEANRWLTAASPLFAARVRATAIVDTTLICQCVSGVVVAAVKERERAFMAHLATSFPGYPVARLKCLVRGGTLPDDDGLAN